VSFAAIFDLELGFDHVGGPAAVLGLGVGLALGVPIIVGTLEILKPLFD
jgi:hypothetical protein